MGVLLLYKKEMNGLVFKTDVTVFAARGISATGQT